MWHCHQLSLLSLLKSAGTKLTLGGDGRADSPGHSAKYGSYTVMDLEQHVVVDMQLVQVYTHNSHKSIIRYIVSNKIKVCICVYSYVDC